MRWGMGVGGGATGDGSGVWDVPHGGVVLYTTHTHAHSTEY